MNMRQSPNQESDPVELTEEINLKTVEVYLNIPGLEVKWKIPGIGKAELKNHCTVDPKFSKNSLEVTAIVKMDNGEEKKYKYTIQKLPGEIITQECGIKYKDGQITLILKKKDSLSWEVQLKKGLEQISG